MYAFAINIVDSSIDAKICKQTDDSNESVGKCKKGTGASGTNKLSAAFPSVSGTEKVGSETSKTVATETAALTKRSDPFLVHQLTKRCLCAHWCLYITTL